MEKIKVLQPYKAGVSDVKDVIAPAGLEIQSSLLKLGNKLVKSFFIFTYPRYLSSGWFDDILNQPELFDVSIFVHPVDTATALKNFLKKTAQLEAQILEREEKGLVRDPKLETAYQDIEALRDQLQQAQEKIFNVGVYFAIYADSNEELSRLENKITTEFESKLVYTKQTVFQQLEGFNSTLPLCSDKLLI